MNAAEDETGQLRGTDRRTNVWAWRHPHRAEGTVTYTRLQGSVVLDHVDFGYDEKKLVLHDISLWAKPGQKIAFAGATGAGKTTITNLINRFYDIADGFIRRLPDGYDTMLDRRRSESEPGPETASCHCPCGRGGSAGAHSGGGHLLHGKEGQILSALYGKLRRRDGLISKKCALRTASEKGGSRFSRCGCPLLFFL